MKVIDKSELRSADGSISVTDQLRGVWQYGLSWRQDIEAQDVFITHASRLLDNKYTLLRNVALPGLEIPIPLILIGPTGIWLIYASGAKGIYRAKSETWAVMDNRSQHFRLANPNLLARTILMSRAVESHLSSTGYQLPGVESVLFLSNPGVHVDSVRPAARIVLLDAIDRFAAGITQAHNVIEPEIVERTVNALNISETKLAEPEPVAPMASKAPKLPGADLAMRPYGMIGMYLPIWQWAILGVMLIMEIIILLAFVSLIMFTV
jgi:hypothetical protein